MGEIKGDLFLARCHAGERNDEARMTNDESMTKLK